MPTVNDLLRDHNFTLEDGVLNGKLSSWCDLEIDETAQTVSLWIELPGVDLLTTLVIEYGQDNCKTLDEALVIAEFTALLGGAMLFVNLSDKKFMEVTNHREYTTTSDLFAVVRAAVNSNSTHLTTNKE